VIHLSRKWAPELLSQRETGMGYQIATIYLHDGTRFDQVAIVEGIIAQIRGRKDIPFTEDQIVQIVVTHDKWDFNAER
jgi:hypothetical protein